MAHSARTFSIQPVTAAVSGAAEFLPHGLCERPASPALFAIGVLGAPRGEIGGDAALAQSFEVGLAAITRVSRGLLGLAAKVFLNAIDKRDELGLIAHALRQLMGNDDLRRSIHRGLRVVALDIAVFGEQDAAIGIGEVAALALASGSPDGALAFLPGFLLPCDLRFSSASCSA